MRSPMRPPNSYLKACGKCEDIVRCGMESAGRGLRHRNENSEPLFGNKRCDGEYLEHFSEKLEQLSADNDATTNIWK
jgi:hypothetical protein